MKTLNPRCIVFLIGTLIGPLSVQSAEPVAASGASAGTDLPGVIRAAKTRFRPVDAQDVSAARESLDKSLAALEGILGPPAKAQRWKNFLRWSLIEEQLAAGRSPDPEQLRRLQRRFVGDHAGLEMQKFTDVRDALGEYAQVIEDRSNPTLRQDFEAHLDELANGVESYLALPEPGTRDRIATHVGWLENRSQADTAVTAVRRAVSRPNVLLHVPESMFAASFRKRVDETGPVRDVILGTQIYGTGHTVGYVSPVLAPGDDEAAFRIDMTATSHANTVGYNGPVRVYQRNHVQLHGQKRIIVDRNGLSALRAESAAAVESHVTGMGTTYRCGLISGMVRRKAYQRVRSQKAQADRIAEDHQRQRLNEQLDRDVDARLAKSNAELKEKLLHPLVRYDVFPRQLATRTRGDCLLVVAELATATQLGAVNKPPPVAGGADLVLQVEESLVENYAAAALGGRTYTSDQLMAMIDQATQDSDESDADDGDGDVVTIVLDNVKPVTLRIDAGTAAVTLHGRQYIARKQSYPPMDVTVRYQLEPADGGIRLVRQAELEIVPPRFRGEGPHRFSLREATLRRLLRNQLQRDLPDQLFYDGIRLEGQLSALGKLSIVGSVAEKGWLTLNCRQEEPADGSSG